MQKTNGLKVGILTFHRCINYGSYWQARCLADGLRSLGHEVAILDHYSARINLAEWKCAYRPVLPIPVDEADYPLYRQKIKKFFEAFHSLPFSRPFPLDKPEQMDNYDAVVVGSDEVWNLFHPWYGQLPLFYGEGIKAERLVSYAASFGNYPASWGINESWGRRLKNFDMISVRDENSFWLVKNALGNDPEIVLDPCLQFPSDADDVDFPFQQPYLAVYGHNFSEQFVAKMKAFASRRKLPLISVGYRNHWADEQWITAGPQEFVHFIRNSEAVLTNFFHGCIFSLRYEKPFMCEASIYRNNKVHGLMTLIGGEQHLVSDDKDDAFISNMLSTPLQPLILERITSLRQSSTEFLQQSLGIDQLKVA